MSCQSYFLFYSNVESISVFQSTDKVCPTHLSVLPVTVSSTVWRPACRCGRGRVTDLWLTWTAASSTRWHCRWPVSHRPYVSPEAKCGWVDTGPMGAHPVVNNAPWEALSFSGTVLYRWGRGDRTQRGGVEVDIKGFSLNICVGLQ